MFHSRGLSETDRHRLALMIRPPTINPEYNPRNGQHQVSAEEARYRLINSLLNTIPRIQVQIPDHLIERVGRYSSVFHRKRQSYHEDSRCMTYLDPMYELFRDIQLVDRFVRRQMIYQMPNEVLNVMKWVSDPTNKPITSTVNFIFTSSRGIRSIMNCIYSPTIGWTLVVIKMGPFLILTVRDSSALIQNEQVQVACSDSTYTCFKFNEMITLTLNGKRPRIHDKDNRRSFYTINRLTIGRHKVLYPTRIDCLTSSNEIGKPLQSMQTAQTRMNPVNGEQEMFVLVNWWTAAFLNASDIIIRGDKASKNKLREITTLPVDSLYRGEWEGRWSPHNCLNQLHFTLDLIRSMASNDLVVYGFYWNRAHQRVVANQLNESYTKYIPSWFSLSQ